MANEEHLALLKQGVEVWNEWQEKYLEPQSDLSGGDLSEADLRGVDLSGANLSGADLSGADLSEANLSGANLNGANLSMANLYKAGLFGADLSEADLRQANLIEADLSDIDLSDADLRGADLSHAKMWKTVLTDQDLRQVKGLDTVEHLGPSNISIQMVFRSHGDIPEVFLRGAGVSESFIEYMHSLVGKPIDYYSAFISYSSQDQAFAERLYADLQTKGVRCWFAPHDLKIGAKIRSSIDASIRLHDKLLLVLSRASVASQWVEQEVEKALERERKAGNQPTFETCIKNQTSLPSIEMTHAPVKIFYFTKLTAPPTSDGRYWACCVFRHCQPITHVDHHASGSGCQPTASCLHLD